MPKQPALQNNFTGGLKTEFTGLNFPENACTSVSNCVFTIIGDVVRRAGIDFEENFIGQNIFEPNSAVNFYRWKNAGGDGLSEILVQQSGSNVYFFLSSASTTTSPLSTQILMTSPGSAQVVNLLSYVPSYGIAPGSPGTVPGQECQFADGNGYLFIFHPSCDPLYCTYSDGVVTPYVYYPQIRDFNGYPDGLNVTTRPGALTDQHSYNLQNQGWGTASSYWDLSAAFLPPMSASQVGTGAFYNYTVNTGAWALTATIINHLNIVVGQTVNVSGSFKYTGTVNGVTNNSGTVSYSGTGTVLTYPGSGSAITIDVTSLSGNTFTSFVNENFNGASFAISFSSENVFVSPQNSFNNQISTWVSAANVYPSNADIWWLYKASDGSFDPADLLGTINAPTSPAPKGHFILYAFNQDYFSVAANLDPSMRALCTPVRPQTGCWFQGRVWYSGVNASVPAFSGNADFLPANYYTWTENIYFSPIITTNTGTNAQFGQAYQNNDPTDENFPDLEPDDGGVIVIQGAGNIYKLFPVQNGLLVFASNGIWFITGSTGIGFLATDYTITKISNVKTLSATSFINVLGYPVFWNEEAIYTVSPSRSGTGGFEIEPITTGTILSFYNAIPKISKAYARGDYDPINYVISWVYRSTPEMSISNRYEYDSVLSMNLYNKAFYPYTIADNGNSYVCGLVYMDYPSEITAPDPGFKYCTSVGNYIVFAEERDDVNWIDWLSYDQIGVYYTSFFETGYSLGGKAVSKWQPIIVEMYSRGANQYTIQGVWDYATSGNSGRYSSVQVVTNPNNVTYQSGIAGPDLTDYQMYYRRHKIRGYGVSLQLVVSSVQGQPFDIMGWSVVQDINQGI